MDLATLILLLVVATLAAVAGGLAAYLRAQQRHTALRAENHQLRAQLLAEQRLATERKQAFQEARDQLSATFSALSSEALRDNNEHFLRLAQEKLQQFQLQAKADLGEREKAIEGLVSPIRDALQKTEQQIRLMEHERKEAYGSLSQHLHSMALAQQHLQNETRNLVQALRRPEVRGRWGELTLRRLAELAGMVEHCDFYEQESINSEEGLLRPDMIVRLPNGREIVVDAKTPLDAYLNAVEAGDDETRRQELLRHANKVKDRVTELARKGYWQQFKNAPDFVVLFIPGEQFLSAAQEIHRNLLEDALRDKVVLATPTSFVALLRAVAFGWRQEVVAEHAERIRELGETLYRRTATFSEHLARLGKSLSGSVEHYNKAVGSLERQLLPSARRFTELGIESRKAVESPLPIESAPREPSISEEH
ncbi:DNA recombination protein RmuC [Alkalilimnicola ehrlichii]|uniref:DNA recombination protein RmuC n=1 Tax=Alkalilimnicola ehrlichii TaxID=351052 RepID=A0A3E0WXP8_9GAMM|nr:DNA recombination protein RmuC [Alkalilimnicola ehrlichii]RFA36941.1 DNA recombination protein RmuC [Alkalilimnicola ehrlichii]